MSEQEYIDVNRKLELIAQMDGFRGVGEKVKTVGLPGFYNRDHREDAKEILSLRDEYLTFIVNHRADTKKTATFTAKNSHNEFMLKQTQCNSNHPINYFKELLKLLGATLLGIGALEFRFLLNDTEPDKALLLLALIGFTMAIIGLFMPTKSKVTVI